MYALPARQVLERVRRRWVAGDEWIDEQPRVPQLAAPAGVKVYIVKFNDYQCPACKMTFMAYKDIFAKYEASNPTEFRYETRVGNVGINVGVAAPMAYFPFSGWKDSFFGDLHAQGRDAIDFYTEKKVVVERWPSNWSRKF